MSEEDDKPNRQVESIRLDIGTEVTNDGCKLWITLREIGKGAFGTVYHVVNKNTKQDAALKVERMTGGDNLLKIEKEIMEGMQNEPTAIHVFDDGIFNDYRFIVMTLCGPDLQKISELMNNTFNPDTICRLCIRTLLAIKTLHEYEYIHRDLKPCNFAVDYNPNSLHVYLFDYGMARRYAKKDSNNKYWLRRARDQAQFRGTIRYCSLNMHKRKELGRVDDVWSWFFMMMEMRSVLPWSATTVPEKAEAFKEEHLIAFLEKDLFLRSFVPIVAMLNATDYADRPDYAKMYDILYAKLRENNGKLSGPMEYDAARMNALPAEAKEMLKPQSRMDDELTIQKYLSSSFNKVVIHGGANTILEEYVDFFGVWDKQAKIREEKNEEMKKQQKNHQHKQTMKNKMLGKPKQPNSGTGKKEGQSSAGSKISLQKKLRGARTKN